MDLSLEKVGKMTSASLTNSIKWILPESMVNANLSDIINSNRAERCDSIKLLVTTFDNSNTYWYNRKRLPIVKVINYKRAHNFQREFSKISKCFMDLQGTYLRTKVSFST